MRNIILFVVIITILGSLSEKPNVVMPCSMKLEEVFYLHRKKVKTFIFESFIHIYYRDPLPMHDEHTNSKFLFDSLTITTK